MRGDLFLIRLVALVFEGRVNRCQFVELKRTVHILEIRLVDARSHS